MTLSRWAVIPPLALLVVVSSAARRALDAQAQPTFRSSVDLVPVDVNVIDKSGRPVTGLEAEHFVLTVDGKVRRIVSAQYVAAGESAAGPPAPIYYSSNRAAAGGRLIMFVVDQTNIGAGRGKLALDAAARFVSKLGPGAGVATSAHLEQG